MKFENLVKVDNFWQAFLYNEGGRAFYSLLFARYLLLVTRYFLLVNRYILLVTRY